jgi:hypothetical protein
MMKKLPNKIILQSIIDFYINSGDFNGMPLSRLIEEFDCEWPNLRRNLASLVKKNKISLTFPNFGNPHIKITPHITPHEQLVNLKSAKISIVNGIVIREDGTIDTDHKMQAFDGGEICAYPTEMVIRDNIDISEFNDKPFTQMLLLGAPQIYPSLFFEIKVLERYYNDPRYLIGFDDYRGTISIADRYSDNPDTLERDKCAIEFGLGFDSRQHRMITVTLRKLNRLPSEQQLHWKTHMIYNECQISESYYKNIIMGEFAEAEGVSIYKAFIKEQVIINEMCILMRKPKLFRNTHENNRPLKFSIILVPTKENYLNFVHTLDKMLSENINKKFFKNDVELKDKITEQNGNINIKERNTISLLDEWLRKYFLIKDNEIFDKIIVPLKNIRDIRHNPAHKIIENEYHINYWVEQNEMIEKAYNSLRNIRLLFTLHPNAKDYKVPTWLYDGRIINY